MKKLISSIIAAATLVAAIAGCSPAPASESSSVSASRSSATYAKWLSDRLAADGITPDGEIIVGDAADAETYGVDMSGIMGDGYIIRRTAAGDDTLIFGKTALATDMAVRYYANYCNKTGPLNVVEGEGYRVGSITIAGVDLSEYVIVCPADADECQRYAADELQRFLGDACGIYPEIVTETGGYAITLVCDKTGETYGDEAFNIKSDETGVTITGGRYRGCMYGVYDFLEEYIGYRFYYGNIENNGHDNARVYLYEAEEINIGNVDYTEFPSITVRDTYSVPIMSSPALKYNGQRYDGWAKYGGYGRIVKACHGHETYISDSELTELGYIGGYKDNVNPCFTDEYLTELLIERVLTHLRGVKASGAVMGKNFTTVDISQRDISAFCKCENCMKVYSEDAAMCGPGLRLANAVAEAIEPEFPEITVAVLAYFGTSTPPKTTVPHKNVQISFCFYIADNKTLFICGKHSISGEGCDINSYFAELFEGWSALTSNLYVWYYPMSGYFNGYSSTYTNNVYHDIKYLAEQNTYGIFYLSGMTTVRPNLINWYMGQRMMWDATITEEEYHEMLKEYLWLTYGDGYEFVYEFIQIMETAADRTLDCFCGFHSKFEDKLNMGYIEESLDRIFYLREMAMRLARTTEEENLVYELFATAYYYEIAVLHDDMWVNGDDSARTEYKAMVDSYITNYSWLYLGDSPCTPTLEKVDYNVNPFDWVKPFG